MKSNCIALIEIGGSHDECLLSQMSAIHSSGREVLLITFKEVYDRNKAFVPYVSDTLFVDMSGSKSQRGKEVSRIWKKLKESNCEMAVLNTAEGNLVRLLCIKALFHKIKFVGIVHDARKFGRSFTQRIINKKVKKYLMLSDNLVRSISPDKGLIVDYFYPLRYDTDSASITKSTKSIVIIGGVETRRKDLDGFVEMAKQVKGQNLTFTFLGKSNLELKEVQYFKKRIESDELTGIIETFEKFVPQKIFDATLQNANLILPLVHPNTPSAEEYFKTRMSGAMCVSFGYKIPMLLHQQFAGIEEMQAASFYYTIDTFKSALLNALEESNLKMDQMDQHEAYNMDFQEKKYLTFLLS